MEPVKEAEVPRKSKKLTGVHFGFFTSREAISTLCPRARSVSSPYSQIMSKCSDVCMSGAGECGDPGPWPGTDIAGRCGCIEVKAGARM